MSDQPATPTLYDALPNGDPASVSETLRQVEIYLGAQLSLSIAADQRATSFASFMAAGAVVIGGGGVSALLVQEVPDFVGGLALAMSLGLVGAMLLANYSARPIEFAVVGFYPERFSGLLGKGAPPASLQAAAIEFHSAGLRRNSTNIRRNSRFMAAALMLAAKTIFVGVLAGAIYFIFW